MLYSAAKGRPPAPGKYDRAPDYMADLDDNGRFSIEAPAGRYYLAAVKRLSDDPIGPPKAGDYVWRGVDLKGRPKVYVIRPGGRLDIGTVSGAAPLMADIMADRPVTTAIEGFIIDMDGNPVADALVIAFGDPSLQGKPQFVSERTDKDGKYLLRVAPGVYYLRARSVLISGPPEPGQIVGYYGQAAPEAVVVKKDELKKDVNFRVIMFPGRGPFSGAPPPGR